MNTRSIERLGNRGRERPNKYRGKLLCFVFFLLSGGFRVWVVGMPAHAGFSFRIYAHGKMTRSEKYIPTYIEADSNRKR